MPQFQVQSFLHLMLIFQVQSFSQYKYLYACVASYVKEIEQQKRSNQVDHVYVNQVDPVYVNTGNGRSETMAKRQSQRQLALPDVYVYIDDQKLVTQE